MTSNNTMISNIAFVASMTDAQIVATDALISGQSNVPADYPRSMADAVALDASHKAQTANRNLAKVIGWTLGKSVSAADRHGYAVAPTVATVAPTVATVPVDKATDPDAVFMAWVDKSVNVRVAAKVKSPPRNLPPLLYPNLYQQPIWAKVGVPSSLTLVSDTARWGQPMSKAQKLACKFAADPVNGLDLARQLAPYSSNAVFVIAHLINARYLRIVQ
jgi:hypothetical protein